MSKFIPLFVVVVLVIIITVISLAVILMPDTVNEVTAGILGFSGD